jgi:hypothetical protein
MAHTHEHDENYFLDQIFTIALCGALGGIAVMLYVRKTMLNDILDKKFHLWVLLGGIGLLVMVAIRAMAVWRLAGQSHSHAHDHHHHHHHHHHDHAHDHHQHDPHHHHEHGDHDHAHGEHDHGHHHGHTHPHTHAHEPGHEHGWSPWRYTVLMLPVVLFFLNLPNSGLTARYTDLNATYPADKKALTAIGLLASPMAPAPLLAAAVLPEDEVLEGLGFSELERAAFDPMRRKRYEGKLATLEGMLVARPDFQQFNIVRYRMNCCAADALPINAAVLVDPGWTGDKLDVRKRHQKWVRVKGRIHFFPRPNAGNEYVSALIVTPDKENSPNQLVEIIDRPENPYAD